MDYQPSEYSYSAWRSNHMFPWDKLEPLFLCSTLNGEFCSKLYIDEYLAYQILRKGSGIQMDMTFAKQHNNFPTSHSGIIEFRRSIDALSKWNLIKHEEAQFIVFMNLCDIQMMAKFRW